jgi:tetratricopeptide (TPR) repeat protein
VLDTTNPVFFDLRSGEPAVWFGKSRTGNVELFSLMGFHPDTGDELLPITKEIAASWKDQQEKPKRASQKVDPKTYVFFDQITGEPRAWYWRSADGDYEFYDGPGYHPRTGDTLVVLSKDLVLKLQKEAVDQAKRQADVEAATKRAEVEATKRRSEELEKLSQAEKRCDVLAANPNDQNRVGEGVPFELLKPQVREAIEACENAIRQNPTEPRLQYQLARALQLSDRKRAFPILQKLVSQRYPAAFDNIGWIFFFDQKNPEAAVSAFRSGVQLNDSDSMVSLAEMIDRNHATPRTQAETKLALYNRAAALGNAAGTKAEQVELQKQGVEQQSKEMQIQQAKIAGEVFNIILRGIAR